MTGTRITIICFCIICAIYIYGLIKYPELKKNKQNQTVIILMNEEKE